MSPKNESFRFNLRFITPLLIHGTPPGKADIENLYTSLPGVWRYWCRALIGGMIPGISREDLNYYENLIFGSTSQNTIASFTITPDQLNYENKIHPGFERGKFGFKGFLPDVVVLVDMTLRKNVAEKIRDAFFATVWLWGTLGGIGQRSRRGFGSPVLEIPHGRLSPFGSSLPCPGSFQDVESVKSHLSKGLKAVWMVFTQFLDNQTSPSGEKPAITGSIASNEAPTKSPWFVVQSLKQIAIGINSDKNYKRVLSRIHGSSKCNGIGFAIRNQRWASPVHTRLYLLADKSYVPVATCCDQIPPKGCIEHKNQDCIEHYKREAFQKKWVVL